MYESRRKYVDVAAGVRIAPWGRAVSKFTRPASTAQSRHSGYNKLLPVAAGESGIQLNYRNETEFNGRIVRDLSSCQDLRRVSESRCSKTDASWAIEILFQIVLG